MIWFESVFAAAAVLIADQVSKAFVTSRTTSHKLVLKSQFVSILCVINRRGVLASFGGRPALLAIWSLFVTVAALMLYSGILAVGTSGPIGIGAAVGGATGNLLDHCPAAGGICRHRPLRTGETRRRPLVTEIVRLDV
jgi:lipoprotein signal peptidase